MNALFDLAILDAALSVALLDPSKVSDVIAANGRDLEDVAMSRERRALLGCLHEAHTKSQPVDLDLLASGIAQSCDLGRKDIADWLSSLSQPRAPGSFPLHLARLRALRFRRRLVALSEHAQNGCREADLLEALEIARREWDSAMGAPLTAIDFASTAPPMPDPLVGNAAQQLMIPGEKLLLASDSGVGKTQLGVALALGIASGTEAVGFDCQARPVLYVSSDFDPALGTKFRRQAAGRRLTMEDLAHLPLSVVDDPEFCLDDPAHLRRLGANLELLGARERSAVLFVETISTNVRPSTTDLHNEVSVREFIRRSAGRLSNEFPGLTFTMSHHLRKPQAGGANDFASRIAGSVQLRAGFDSVVGLVGAGQDRFTVRSIKRSRSSGAFRPFNVEIRGDRLSPLSVVNLGPTDTSLDMLRGAALAAMNIMRRVHQPMTVESIAAGCPDFGIRALQAACKRLADAGQPLLVRVSRKPATYQLAPEPANDAHQGLD